MCSTRTRSFFAEPLVVLLAGLTAVVAVEAAALEHHADLAEQLAQAPVALGALGQRVVAERLHHVELVVALGARIRIGRHEPSVMVKYLALYRLKC